MKVHMANVTTASSGVRETNLSIQIRSVEIDLTTIFMDDIASFLDAVLEHAEGRWVCDLGNKIRPETNVALGGDADHESCEVGFVLHRLCTKVHNVEATVGQTLHRDHLQPGHDCGLEVLQHQKLSA
jgi:hypothetical protein